MTRPKEIPEEVEVPDPIDQTYDPNREYSGSDEDLTMLGLYSPDNTQFRK